MFSGFFQEKQQKIAQVKSTVEKAKLLRLNLNEGDATLTLWFNQSQVKTIHVSARSLGNSLPQRPNLHKSFQQITMRYENENS